MNLKDLQKKAKGKIFDVLPAWVEVAGTNYDIRPSFERVEKLIDSLIQETAEATKDVLMGEKISDNMVSPIESAIESPRNQEVSRQKKAWGEFNKK